MAGSQKRCALCRFWEFLPGEPPPAEWGRTRERVGLCQEPAAQARERRLRLYGAGGLCAKYSPKPAEAQ